MIFLGILVSFIMFLIIVIIHEYGHYKTARIFGVSVDEFGLGIPPRAKKLWKNKDGTLFSLNWIPLGGFVKIAGESETFLHYYEKKGKLLSLKGLEKKIKNQDDIFTKSGQKISKQERKYILAALKNQKSGNNFYEKNIFVKTLILSAGVIMNFILAGVIFSLLFFIGVKPIGINSVIPTNLPVKLIPTLEESLRIGVIEKSQGIILTPIEGSRAEASGIRRHDLLLYLDGISINDIGSTQEYISSRAENSVTFSVQREESIVDITIIPDEQGKIGSYLSENISLNEDFEYKYDLLEAIKYGFLETYYQARLTLTGLQILLKNIFIPEVPEDREKAIEQVAGPIGIVHVITQSLSGGITLLLILGAIISVNLGVFNLLPIPALDGGRILLLWTRSLIDAVFGKTALSANIENTIHVLFFLVLIALSLIIAYNDIGNLLGK